MSSAVVAARVPMLVEIEADWFCACKQTGKSPLCDGSHKKLP